MQFDYFVLSPQSLEQQILHLSPEEIEAIKRGITSLKLNFTLPEGLDDLERRQLVQISEEALLNCSGNLLPVLLKFITTKSRLDSKFRLNDGVLFTDDLEIEIEIDIKPIFNELYRIINYILKTLLDHYLNEIKYYGETINYINDSSRFTPFEKAAIELRLKDYIEEYKTKFSRLSHNYLTIINFNIDYLVNNFTKNPDFYLDENIIKIIFSLIRYTDVSIFTPSLDRLMNIVFTNRRMVLHLKLESLYLISSVKRFNLSFYEEAVKKPIDIYYYVDLALTAYKKFVENKSLTELFRDILNLHQMIDRFLAFLTMANRKIDYNGTDLVNYIYAMLDLYFEVNKIQSPDLAIIQVRILEQIYTLLNMCPQLIETDLVKFIPYTFINAINLNEFVREHTPLVEKISCLLSVNKKYIFYIVNSCPSIERYESILVCHDELRRYMEVFRKITETNNPFEDDITSEFIITIGLLPMTNGELKICDRFVILSALRNKGKHPYTNEALTVEDFLQIQDDNKERIDELEQQRREFVAEVKRK